MNSETINDTANASRPVDSTRVFGPQRDTLYIVLPITIIYTFIFVSGLLGNIFTCIVIVRNKNLHTATNYYLFSLAISDLLLLVSGMPQEMYSIWSKWPYVFGHTFCVIRGLAAETSTNASVLTITLFTIERYLAICHPFVSHKMSKLSRAVKHVVLLWVAALALALPQALQFGIRQYQGVIMCLQTRVIIEHSFEISTFLFFLAPMVLITVLYSFIGLKLREKSNVKEQNQNDFESSIRYSHKMCRKPSQSTRRVIKMLDDCFQMTLCCCGTRNDTAVKRSSYTAMAFVRHPTSSGTSNSGNSIRNETNLQSKTRRTNSRDKILNGAHVCGNGTLSSTTVAKPDSRTNGDRLLDRNLINETYFNTNC
uniref:G-protein coupled receptors family 1 profile domain-containing protein n=1 Tax=Bombyx mori TaxID=7091 RepID=A0A8R2R000_BOMMO|nr:diapause hormone receptor-1 isoform X2 [Bombyx mori]